MIMDLVDELHRTHGLTSVFATHNPVFARRADRVLSLDGGALGPLAPSKIGNQHV
jgi:lipoprotein-releasing system ATP-binding protein